MKFLIDRCADWLRRQGHDVKETRDSGEDPGDAAILERAVSEDRVLVSIDKDFGDLVFRAGRTHRGLVRLPDVRAEIRTEIMRELLVSHGDALDSGAVITVRGGRVRISSSAK